MLHVALIGFSWSINGKYPDFKIEHVTLNSERDLADFDLIIWNPTKVVRDFGGSINNQIVFTGYKNLQLALKRHYQEIEEFLDLGKLLVILLPPPDIFSYTEEKHGSLKQKSIIELMPFRTADSKFETVPSAGANILIKTTSDALKKFFELMKSYLKYLAYFSQTIGEPFLFTKSNKPIGSVLARKNGHVIFLPHIEIKPLDVDSQILTIVKALEELSFSLREKSPEVTLPEWASQYFLPNEQTYLSDITSLETAKEKLILEINIKKNQLTSLQKRKLLFAGGTGEILVEEVILALEKLELKVEKGEPGRVDLVSFFENMPIVVEVKGNKKSGGEDDAAQLEKWSSEYYANQKKEPKALLLVNAYRDLPLKERKEKAFPDQMLNYAKRKEQCLMTTTQLLKLSLLAEEKPVLKKKICESIIQTVGIYDSFEEECKEYLN